MKEIEDVIIARRLLRTYASAKDREIECSLSFKKMKQLLRTQKCYYTGKVLSDKDGDVNQLTIDRVNNDIGYVDSNVVACTHLFNVRKNNLTLNEVRLIYNKTKNR